MTIQWALSDHLYEYARAHASNSKSKAKHRFFDDVINKHFRTHGEAILARLKTWEKKASEFKAKEEKRARAPPPFHPYFPSVNAHSNPSAVNPGSKPAPPPSNASALGPTQAMPPAPHYLLQPPLHVASSVPVMVMPHMSSPVSWSPVPSWTLETTHPGPPSSMPSSSSSSNFPSHTTPLGFGTPKVNYLPSPFWSGSPAKTAIGLNLAALANAHQSPLTSFNGAPDQMLPAQWQPHVAHLVMASGHMLVYPDHVDAALLPQVPVSEVSPLTGIPQSETYWAAIAAGLPNAMNAAPMQNLENKAPKPSSLQPLPPGSAPFPMMPGTFPPPSPFATPIPVSYVKYLKEKLGGGFETTLIKKTIGLKLATPTPLSARDLDPLCWI